MLCAHNDANQPRGFFASAELALLGQCLRHIDNFYIQSGSHGMLSLQQCVNFVQSLGVKIPFPAFRTHFGFYVFDDVQLLLEPVRPLDLSG